MSDQSKVTTTLNNSYDLPAEPTEDKTINLEKLEDTDFFGYHGN